MIFEGLKLMLAGMFVVYVFLSALLVMIKISARFFAGATEQPSVPPLRPSKNGGGDGEIAAVISAAVTAYRAGKA